MDDTNREEVVSFQFNSVNNSEHSIMSLTVVAQVIILPRILSGGNEEQHMIPLKINSRKLYIFRLHISCLFRKLSLNI
jgi:hypothetical protein